MTIDYVIYNIGNKSYWCKIVLLDLSYRKQAPAIEEEEADKIHRSEYRQQRNKAVCHKVNQ